MPELPEVETMCRGLRAIVGARIVRAQRAPCRARPIRIAPRIDRFNRQAAGRCIQRVCRVGKRVMVVLETGQAIEFQPRMTGLVTVGQPPSTSHLRFRLSLSGGAAGELLFWDRRGLGSVQLLPAGQWQVNPGGSRLGRDALKVQPGELRQLFAASGRPIKVALMDQTRIAGIGNLYASEILHVARVHPAVPCRQLSAAQWQRVHAAIGLVLNDAICHEGSTLSDGTYRNALNQPGNYQNCHRVYGRAGQTCPSCHRAGVQRIVQAQRSTFFCPHCQRARVGATRPRPNSLHLGATGLRG